MVFTGIGPQSVDGDGEEAQSGESLTGMAWEAQTQCLLPLWGSALLPLGLGLGSTELLGPQLRVHLFSVKQTLKGSLKTSKYQYSF